MLHIQRRKTGDGLLPHHLRLIQVAEEAMDIGGAKIGFIMFAWRLAQSGRGISTFEESKRICRHSAFRSEPRHRPAGYSLTQPVSGIGASTGGAEMVVSSSRIAASREHLRQPAMIVRQALAAA